MGLLERPRPVFTYGMWKCLPCHSNGPGSVQALMITSCASQKRSRAVTGLIPYEWYSIPVPRTKPEMIRPPDITSSIAMSSAVRCGVRWALRMLPITPIRIRSVCAAIHAAGRFGFGMFP